MQSYNAINKEKYIWQNIFIANEMELVQSRKPENVPIMSSCSLYRGYNYMIYSLMDNMRLLYRQRFVE